MHRLRSAIETLLRKYPWALVLGTIVPCAYFAAAGVNYLIASSLLRTDVAALTRPNGASSLRDPTTSDRTSTSHHARDIDQILRRNVFDADAGCLNCAPPPTEDAGTPDAGGDAGPLSNLPPEPCDGSARVTGAVEADDPLWSFIFMAPGAGQPALPRRVGQMFDGRPIASIGWHQRYGAYALLRQPDGRRCFFAQIMPPRQAPPPSPVAAATPAPASGEMGSSLQAAIDQGIERAGANDFNVRRGLVEQILENQAELMRTTRIMPHEEGGRITGVQLFGVRANSLLGRLGMQNGDILNRLNGLEIASPDRALEAYSRLRSADNITVSVTRNGQPVNIEFHIR